MLRIYPHPKTTRIVLVRHGEAECNLNRVIGGPKGCTGLAPLGRTQVAALADRLYESGELRPATALLSSVLPRATETANRLRPSGGVRTGGARPRCGSAATLCELHCQADAAVWSGPRWSRPSRCPTGTEHGALRRAARAGRIGRPASGTVRDVVRQSTRVNSWSPPSTPGSSGQIRFFFFLDLDVVYPSSFSICCDQG